MPTARSDAPALSHRLTQAVWTGLWLCMGLGAFGSLSGCATPPPERRDVVTASDQTDGERRARVRLELAIAYFGRGMNTTALDEVKQAITAKPDMAEAHSLRGLIYGALDEPQLAEDSFKRALSLAPRDGDVMHNYGWFLCQQQRFAEADAQFSQAVQSPTYRDTIRTLLAQGVCQARNNRLSEAERTLARAYELDPSNPATAVNLSEVLYKEGEYERARFYIRRVNTIENLSNAQTLWLAIRIEKKLAQNAQVQILGNQLRNRFPDAPETLLYEKGRFDE